MRDTQIALAVTVAGLALLSGCAGTRAAAPPSPSPAAAPTATPSVAVSPTSSATPNVVVSSPTIPAVGTDSADHFGLAGATLDLPAWPGLSDSCPVGRHR